MLGDLRIDKVVLSLSKQSVTFALVFGKRIVKRGFHTP
jgi:hypothetical protein